MDKLMMRGLSGPSEDKKIPQSELARRVSLPFFVEDGLYPEKNAYEKNKLLKAFDKFLEEDFDSYFDQKIESFENLSEDTLDLTRRVEEKRDIFEMHLKNLEKAFDQDGSNLSIKEVALLEDCEMFVRGVLEIEIEENGERRYVKLGPHLFKQLCTNLSSIRPFSLVPINKKIGNKLEEILDKIIEIVGEGNDSKYYFVNGWNHGTKNAGFVDEDSFIAAVEKNQKKNYFYDENQAKIFNSFDLEKFKMGSKEEKQTMIEDYFVNTLSKLIPSKKEWEVNYELGLLLGYSRKGTELFANGLKLAKETDVTSSEGLKIVRRNDPNYIPSFVYQNNFMLKLFLESSGSEEFKSFCDKLDELEKKSLMEKIYKRLSISYSYTSHMDDEDFMLKDFQIRKKIHKEIEIFQKSLVSAPPDIDDDYYDDDLPI